MSLFSTFKARLFAWMGFDGLFFARADYREKDQRKANKTLQMVWQERRTTKVNNQSETKCGEEKSYQDGVVAVAVGQEVVAAGGRCGR